MFRSLLQSRMDISQHALFHMHQQDRVKEFTIHNILQLYAIAELLRTSIQQEKVLLLCEGLTTVFLAQKVSFCLQNYDLLVVSSM